MEVSLLEPYKVDTRVKNSPEIIGSCEYFETAKYKLNFTNKSFNVDSSSFLSVTCVGGEGEIEGERIRKGDSFFCPAGAGRIVVSSGESLEIITVRVPKSPATE